MGIRNVILNRLLQHHQATPSRYQKWSLKQYCILLCSLMLLFISSSYAQAASLQNGGSVTGAISFAGEQDSWTFSASAGERINIQLVDLQQTDLYPKMTLYAPDGSYVTYANNYTVANIRNIAATQSGTYTLIVQDGTSSQEQLGNYAIHLAKSIGANEHGTLINGGSVTESIHLGDLDSWTFEATAGERLNIQLADLDQDSIYVLMTLYAPDGSYVTHANNYTVANIRNLEATQTGTYTLVVQDGTSRRDGIGNYELHFAKSIGANEHGTLINGGSITESIELGDLDSWTFEAAAGERLNIQLADLDQNSIYVLMTLYAPDGSYVTHANNYTVANIRNLEATQTGTYTLVVQDGTRRRDGIGNYELHFAKSIGANEHGTLINGGSVTESIELGDLDSWTFEATAGERLNIQLADLDQNSIYVLMTLYAPDGSYVTHANNYTVANIRNLEATQTGTYTLVVQDGTSRRDGIGNYELHFAKSIGANEHGTLINGGSVTESIHLGDLDSWTFEATAGERLNIQLADLDQDSIYVLMTLYAPDGSYVTYANNYTVANIYNIAATQTGTYTLVVQDGTGGREGIGNYELHLAKSTGANEHGTLINGGSVTESIHLGDLDSWTFEATAGERLNIQLADLDQDSIYVLMTLYAPDGSYVTYANNYTVANIRNIAATQTGTYTLVVQDGTGGREGIGNYELHLAKSTGANEHGKLSGVGSYSETIALGDLDSFTFDGNSGDEITLVMREVDTTDIYPLMTLYKPDGSYFTYRTHNSEAGVYDLSLPLAGTYTIVTQDGSGSRSQIGNYVLDFDLPTAAPDPQKPVASASTSPTLYKDGIMELDGSGSFDPDDSPDPLTFNWTLLSVPDDSLIVPADITNATSAIASLQPDVYGEYQVELSVSDGLLSDSVAVFVQVINRVPVANAGVDLNSVVNTTVQLDGSDSSDADGDLLSYQWSVLSMPDSSNLVGVENPTGVTPSFMPDVAGDYVLTLVVSDDTNLSPSDSVIVQVDEANIAPQADIQISGELLTGTLVTLDGRASIDDDNGPQALTYTWSILSTPSGSVITTAELNGQNTNLASFTADVAGTYNVQLTVFDGELSHSVNASVVITEEVVNQAPVADAGDDQQQELGSMVEVSAAASFDPDAGPLPLSFSWAFVSVPAASSLTNTSLDMDPQGNAQFVPDVVGAYTLAVTASDGDLSDIDSVVITVTENQIPVAIAGDDQNIELGANIELDGSDSFDPDNAPQPLSYAWQVLSRPANSTVNIVNSDSILATFQPDVAGEYTLELTVNDGQASGSDVLVIDVTTIAAPKMCDLDDNDFIDRFDIQEIMMRRNTPAMTGFDPADSDQNGFINIIDARKCVLQCDLSRCAIKPE